MYFSDMVFTSLKPEKPETNILVHRDLDLRILISDKI
jgi:hypothetical protein